MATAVYPRSLDIALERREGSRTFSRTGKQISLLRLLLQQAQADGESLKETYIGTVFYNRSASYDPRLDSIVRDNSQSIFHWGQAWHITSSRLYEFSAKE